MTPTYHAGAFARAYYLLDALIADYRDLELAPAARLVLGDALAELTDEGNHLPEHPVHIGVLDLVDAAEGFDELELILAGLLADSPDLATTLRITRVRDFVRAVANEHRP